MKNQSLLHKEIERIAREDSGYACLGNLLMAMIEITNMNSGYIADITGEGKVSILFA